MQVLGVAILLALAGVVVGLAWVIIRWFATADTEVSRAAIAAATSVIVAAATVTITKVLDARREIRAELRARYLIPYDKFTQMLFRMLMETKQSGQAAQAKAPGHRTQAPKSGSSGSSAVSPEAVESMSEFGRAIILQGSSETIRKWGEWRSRDWDAVDDNTRPSEQILGMIDLMVQMRRDLGHKVSADDRYNIGAIFLQADAMQALGLTRQTPAQPDP